MFVTVQGCGRKRTPNVTVGTKVIFILFIIKLLNTLAYSWLKFVNKNKTDGQED